MASSTLKNDVHFYVEETTVTTTALNTPVHGDITISGIKNKIKMFAIVNDTTTNAIAEITFIATNKVYFRVTQFVGTVGDIKVKFYYAA